MDVTGVAGDFETQILCVGKTESQIRAQCTLPVGQEKQQ